MRYAGVFTCNYLYAWVRSIGTKYCYRVRLVEFLFKWIYVIYRWIHVKGTDFLAVKIRQIEDGFNKIEQFGQVKTD